MNRVDPLVLLAGEQDDYADTVAAALAGAGYDVVRSRAAVATSLPGGAGGIVAIVRGRVERDGLLGSVRRAAAGRALPVVVIDAEAPSDRRAGPPWIRICAPPVDGAVVCAVLCRATLCAQLAGGGEPGAAFPRLAASEPADEAPPLWGP